MSFNPFDYPACVKFPDRVAASPFLEHVPFAMALVEMLRPREVVELGTVNGVSYCALCQAISHLGLGARALAVTSATDGSADDLAELRAHHDALYGSFSRIVSAPEAGVHSGPVDLLHVNSEQAVVSRQMVESWLQRLSPRGVVLYHAPGGCGSREAVSWEELKSKYPHFEFYHGKGLGVLATGPEFPEAVTALAAGSPEVGARIRAFYAQLGARITAHWDRRRDHEAAAARLEAIRAAHALELARREQAHVVELKTLRSSHALELADQDARLRRCAEQETAGHVATAAELRTTVVSLRARLAELEQRNLLQRAQLHEKQEVVKLIESQFADREAALRNLQAQMESQGRILEAQIAENRDLEFQVGTLRDRLAGVEATAEARRDHFRNLEAALAAHLLEQVARDSSGVTGALKDRARRWFPAGTRRGRALRLAWRGGRVLRHEGPWAFSRKLAKKLARRIVRQPAPVSMGSTPDRVAA